MAPRDSHFSEGEVPPRAGEEKSARRELADGLGSLFRAAKKAVAEVDPARLEALGLRAMRELDAGRLSELGRKAVERVERFDPMKFAGAAELISVVEKVADQVESFVRSDKPGAAQAGSGVGHSGYAGPAGHGGAAAPPATASSPPASKQPPAAADAASAAKTSGEAGATSGGVKSEPAAESGAAAGTKADDAVGAKWRLRVDD